MNHIQGGKIKNRLICGLAGCGKTRFVKNELGPLLYTNHHLLIFDSVGEYKSFLTHIASDEIYEIPSHHLLNPFYFLESFQDEYIKEFLTLFFNHVLERKLSTSEISSVSLCIETINRDKEQEFSLCYFLSALRKEEIGKRISFEFLMKNKESFSQNNFVIPADKKIILVGLGNKNTFSQVKYYSRIVEKVITNWNCHNHRKKLIVLEEFQWSQDDVFLSFLYKLDIPVWSVGPSTILGRNANICHFFEEFILFRLYDPTIRDGYKLLPFIKQEVWEQTRSLRVGEYFFFTIKQKR